MFTYENLNLPKTRLQDRRVYHLTLLRSQSFIYRFLGFVQTFEAAIFLENFFLEPHQG